MPSKPIHEYLTRRELAEYLCEHNFPISRASLNRLCAPSCGEGPPPAGCWSNQWFYDPVRALAWAHDRFGANVPTRSKS